MKFTRYNLYFSIQTSYSQNFLFFKVLGIGCYHSHFSLVIFILKVPAPCHFEGRKRSLEISRLYAAHHIWRRSKARNVRPLPQEGAGRSPEDRSDDSRPTSDVWQSDSLPWKAESGQRIAVSQTPHCHFERSEAESRNLPAPCDQPQMENMFPDTMPVWSLQSPPQISNLFPQISSASLTSDYLASQ